jgi:ATP-dependent DNA ligase
MTAPGDGKTVLDGEIVCLDKRGRPQFNDLLFHRGEPCFFAFDLLMSDGRDLCTERLTDRKHELRRLISKVSEPTPLVWTAGLELVSLSFVS